MSKRIVLLGLINEAIYVKKEQTFFQKYQNTIFSVLAGFGIASISYDVVKRLSEIAFTSEISSEFRGGLMILSFLFAAGMGLIGYNKVSNYFNKDGKKRIDFTETKALIDKINEKLEKIDMNSEEYKKILYSKKILINGVKRSLKALEEKINKSSKDEQAIIIFQEILKNN